MRVENMLDMLAADDVCSSIAICMVVMYESTGIEQKAPAAASENHLSALSSVERTASRKQIESST